MARVSTSIDYAFDTLPAFPALPVVFGVLAAKGDLIVCRASASR